jgi:ligand-binding sensor domain-containing protein/signal transduction histidine kinase
LRSLNTFRDRRIAGHRLWLTLLAGIACVCLATTAGALDPTSSMAQYIHDSWGNDRGFPAEAIHAICQSADGFLWIGTERGLVRFDGFSFVLIQRPIPDLPMSGPVRGLETDAEGGMWIVLDGPHLLRYREGRFEDAYARFGLKEHAFTAISKDSEGGLLLAGLSSRIFRYYNGKLETIATASELNATANALTATRDGRIWVGSRNFGLLDAGRGSVSIVAKKLANKDINTLLAANNGGLWIGTSAGVEYWDGKGLVKLGLPASINQSQVLAMGKDHESNVWVGTNHGLVRINNSGVSSFDQSNGSSGLKITAVYEDHDGALWYGGPGGIERLRDGTFKTFSTREGLPLDNNGPVYVDAEGRTWFGPASGGLYWLKDDHVEHLTIAGLDKDIVYSISGGDGEVWIGRQRGGLTRLRRNGDSYAAKTYTQADGLPQDAICSVYRNRDGTVWAGTVSAGVSRLKDGVFTNYSVANGMPANSVNSIVEGSDGTVWFATPSGLASFASGHWLNRTAVDGLPAANVKSVFEDSKQVIWAATSGGLAFVVSGHAGVPRTLPEPLREQIFGITEDKAGSLWFATSDRMIRVDRDRLRMGILDDSDVQSYGIEDGLRGVESVRRDRSVAVGPLGKVWVSLSHGLAVVNPQRSVRNSSVVTVRIESTSAEGLPIDLKNSPMLPAGSKGITFNYAGSNLAIPERIRFRYKLDGSSQNWSSNATSRQVVYSHLDPGSYRFRVVASNGEGLWTGPEASIPFTIEPAFWQTWWFRIISLGAFSLVIFGLYRLRIYQLTQQLNIRFQERLAERSRITQELHDTLLQGVLSASLQLDVAEDQLPDDSPTKPLLQRILQLMSKVTEESRNALRGLRTPEINNCSLEMAFSRIRQEFGFDDGVEFRVIVNSNARSLRPMIRDEVYRVGREAIVNAFVHAHAHSVEVEVDYANKHLRILVRDDGLGIDPQVLQTGRDGHWGLPGMRDRSERIGARLRLRSRLGAGTEIELIVPSVIAFESASSSRISRWLPWLSRER